MRYVDDVESEGGRERERGKYMRYVDDVGREGSTCTCTM